MKFIQSFFVSALVAYSAYFAAILVLIDAPIPAEYWVREMIVIKKELTKEHTGKTKIIVTGGSSTLFGFDAEYATQQLNMPVINLGLHAGLQLEKILQTADAVVERGDFLILALEPPYYDYKGKLSAWQVENIIGWDHDTWERMNYLNKAELVSSVSPKMVGEMVVAGFQRRFYPTKINDRLAALDNSLVLSKFRTRTTPLVFGYSAYHLDNHGDMLRAESVLFKGSGQDVHTPTNVSDKTVNLLASFVDAMNTKGVSVYFANTPYIDSGVGKDEIRKSEAVFLKELAPIGNFIDKREDLVLDRKYFFNTEYQLNTNGRAIRTNLFINAIRSNVLYRTDSLIKPKMSR